MKKLIINLLSDFKWYRKRQGGLWYQVYEISGYNTMDGASAYWTRHPKKGVEIIKTEKYIPPGQGR